jgi:O-antigen/teichoic acid export membrane protein
VRGSGKVLQRSVVLNVGGQIASLLVGFAPSILVARWLGPTDRGLYAIIGTTSGIAFVVGSVGLPMAVWYFASSAESQTAQLFGNSLAWAAGLTALFVPLAWALNGDLGAWLAHGHGGFVWVLAAILVPASFLDWTTHNQLLGDLRFGLYNALVVGQKVVFFVGVVLLLWVVNLGVSGVLIATIAGSALVVAGSLRTCLARGRPHLDARLLERMLRYGSRTQIGGVFQYFNSRFDVLILQFFRPLSVVGYYVVAEILAELVMLLARAFQSSVMSLVTRDAEDAATQAETTAVSLRHHALLSLVALVGNAIFSPLLILFAYGPAFHKALLPFFIILPGIWFLGTGLVIANDLNARGRPGVASLLSGLGVCITIVLDLALIPSFGATGAAVGSLVAYVVFGLVSLAVESRVAAIPLRALLPRREDVRLYTAAAHTLGRRTAGELERILASIRGRS